MKYLFLTVSLFIGIHGFSQWIKSPNLLSSKLSDIEALDSDIIYAVGTDAVDNSINGMVFRSLNAGTDWDTLHHVIDQSGVGSWMLKVDAIDNDHIYTTNRSPITYHSNDAGMIWETTTIPTSSNVATDAICFRNADIGLIGNHYGEIFKTADGGLNWELVYSNSPYNPIYDISCPTESTCYARTSMPLKFLKSEDGGNTWNALSSTPNTYLMGGMHAINEDIIVMVCSDALIYRSVDGGTSWDNIPSPVNSDFTDVYFIDNIGFAVGTHETIIKSIDFGSSWTIENMDANSYEVINAIHMINSSSAIACSDSGSIYKLGVFNSINEHLQPNDHITVFPNPFSSHITVDLKQTQNGIILVYDPQGKEIRKIDVKNQEKVNIDLSTVLSNVVFIKFIDEESGAITSKRIIKLR